MHQQLQRGRHQDLQVSRLQRVQQHSGQPLSSLVEVLVQLQQPLISHFFKRQDLQAAAQNA